MTVPPELRPAQSVTDRAALDAALTRALDRMVVQFLQDVIDLAVGAYTGPVLLAAVAPRDERGRYTGHDPFAFTNVMARWRDAVRTLEGIPEVEGTDIIRVLDDADLPVILHQQVADILTTARAEGATPLAVKRRLSAVLIPKDVRGGDWGRYRNRIRGIARNAATAKHNRRIVDRARAAGFTYLMWVSRRDAAVRATHATADGQNRPIGSPFTVGAATLNYPGDPSGPPEETWGCRCVLAAHDNPTLIAGGTMNRPHHRRPARALADLTVFASLTDLTAHPDEDCGCEDDTTLHGEVSMTETPTPEAPTDGDPAETLTASGGPETRWTGVIALEGTPTGDGRMMAPGALTWDTLPIPLRYVSSDVGAHDGAVVVGRIESITRGEGGRVEASGTISLETDAGVEASGKLRRGEQDGVSVDLDQVAYEVRIAGHVLDSRDLDYGGEDRDEDGRVIVHRAHPDDELTVFTAARVRAATIVATPAFEQARIQAVDTRPTLTASAFPTAPPREWFTDPRLDGPTGITVTPEGRVFGHIASWDTCHIGFAQCTTPPHSPSGYAYFHTSAVEAADGEVIPVGKLTVDTGHADVKADPATTAAHYDHTGATAAFVRAGEDAHGIWVAGVLNPDADDKQVRALRSSPQSGDWRSIRGNLELVASLAVNVPGFPIPRPTGFIASGTETTALVAAGMVPPEQVPAPGTAGAFSDDDLVHLRTLLDREKHQARALAADSLAERARAAVARLTGEGGE